jgi:hypothetical protein
MFQIGRNSLGRYWVRLSYLLRIISVLRNSHNKLANALYYKIITLCRALGYKPFSLYTYLILNYLVNYALYKAMIIF